MMNKDYENQQYKQVDEYFYNPSPFQQEETMFFDLSDPDCKVINSNGERTHISSLYYSLDKKGANAMQIIDNSGTLNNLPEVLTAKMIAEYLGIGYVKALHLIQYGSLPHIKIGNTYRVAKKIFEAWLTDPHTKVIELS